MADNETEFKKRFLEVNGLNNKLKLAFDEIRRHNPDMPLDEVLYMVFEEVKDEYDNSPEVLKSMILEASGLDKQALY